MDLKKKDLIISVILILVLAFLSLSIFTDSLAADSYIDWQTNNVNNGNVVNNAINNANKIPVSNNNAVNNNNNPEQLADTGLDDTPWLIIGICVVSAVFAYKKIKEYKVD